MLPLVLRPLRVEPSALVVRVSSAVRSRVWAGGDTEPLSTPVVVGLLVWVPVLVLLDDCMFGDDLSGAEAGEVWAKATWLANAQAAVRKRLVSFMTRLEKVADKKGTSDQRNGAG